MNGTTFVECPKVDVPEGFELTAVVDITIKNFLTNFKSHLKDQVKVQT